MTEQWKKRVYRRRIKNYISRDDWHKLRMECLKRDKFTCQRCEKTSRQGMQAHHIVPRDRGGADDIHNLITLCNKCHDVVEIEGCKTRAEIIAYDDAPVHYRKPKTVKDADYSFTRPEWHKWVYGSGRGTA